MARGANHRAFIEFSISGIAYEVAELLRTLRARVPHSKLRLAKK